MTWKQVKQFETETHSGMEQLGASYLPDGSERWEIVTPLGTKVRVTFEVQEPKYRTWQEGSRWGIEEPEDSAGWKKVHTFAPGYPGGPQAAAEAEVARLNALFPAKPEPKGNNPYPDLDVAELVSMVRFAIDGMPKNAMPATSAGLREILIEGGAFNE